MVVANIKGDVCPCSPWMMYLRGYQHLSSHSVSQQRTGNTLSFYLQGSLELCHQHWAIPVSPCCPCSSYAAGQPHPASLKHQVPKQISGMTLQQIVPGMGMKTNKTACFDNFFWSYPPLREQDWKNSSALPSLTLLFLVAATTHSQTCPPHLHKAPVQVSRDAEDWEKATAESQGLAKRLTVHPH